MRDYIYMGGKLIAEYRPQENATFYYTSDQINSTRIVTDDSGTVVYAAAHDPYGGIQKTWTSAYDPALKFSGKERDTESGLDYFGARYYDHSLYRFLSVDPVISPTLGIVNPQYWNLYAYCGNNPIRFVDKDGRSFLVFLGGPGCLFVFDRSGNLVGVYPASSNPTSKATRYPQGCWGYAYYIDHPNARPEDGIDELGFYGFMAPANRVGSKGLHAGRWSYKALTDGCIRTTRNAMRTINSLHFGGDPIEFLIVVWDSIFDSQGFLDVNGAISSVEFYLRLAGKSDETIDKAIGAIEQYFELIFGPLNFLFDYWFWSESPIPPQAL